MVQKDKAWADITAQYNVNATIPRSEKSLRNCWDNMKKAARKYCAAIKRESYKTGGGVANVTQNILLERVTEVMGETSTYGLMNPFDSDAIDKENTNIEILDDDDDSNENDPNEVFSYLMENENITNWKSWDPNKLKSEISPPLKDKNNTQASSSNTQASSSDSTYKKRKTTQYSKKTLDEVKTDLADTLKVNVEEKKEYEIELLKAQLEKEKLKIELLKVLIEKEKEGNTNKIFKI
ncbi:uncharacterized protein [Temnothorax longispinosus]|uniref:uncharacterized protein isoform X1 n=1 Tax=Temnothorax longispinosus TaxID=300112 RepID=UPI003A990053